MSELFSSYRWKACGLAALLLAGYVIFTMLVPQTVRIRETYILLQVQREKVNSANNWQKKLETYSRQQQNLETFFSKLFVRVPHNDETSAIVELVFSRGREAGITIQRMSPSEPMDRNGFTEIPLVITAQGKFHQILMFVNKLEQAEHLVRLSRLKMSAQKDPLSQELKAEIQLGVMIVRTNRSEEGHG